MYTVVTTERFQPLGLVKDASVVSKDRKAEIIAREPTRWENEEIFYVKARNIVNAF